MNKKQVIEKRLEKIEKNLEDAEAYIGKGDNVKSQNGCHFTDWKGKSGHPLWRKNHMIPSMKKCRAAQEKALETIINKERKKLLNRIRIAEKTNQK